MRQFDVIPNPSPRSRAIAPWLLILQSHHLSAMPTVVAAPMLKYGEGIAYSETSLVVRFDDQEFIVSVGELAAIDARGLPGAVGSLASDEERIRRALDRLFTGF